MGPKALLKALCLVAILLGAGAGNASEKLKVGDPAPAKLGRVKLSDYRGKIVIVSFWASWCAPCRKEMDVLATIQKLATRNKLVVLSVNWREDPERYQQIRRALSSVDLTIRSDSNGDIGDQYDVDAIPHMVIVDRDGRIAAIHVGYGASEIPALAEEISSLLAQGSESPSRAVAP
jgi:thiol-disulfide isomerase/thioredoxin